MREGETASSSLEDFDQRAVVKGTASTRRSSTHSLHEIESPMKLQLGLDVLSSERAGKREREYPIRAMGRRVVLLLSSPPSSLPLGPFQLSTVVGIPPNLSPAPSLPLPLPHP